METGGTSDGERRAYLDALIEKRGYVLDYHRKLAERDFDALVATNGLIEAVYLRERTLDRKTKELIFVNSLTVLRSGKAHIRSHIRAALAAGASEIEVLEAMELALPEAGIVAFQHGFGAFCEELDADTLTGEDSQRKGET